jgi:hypothetical protein
MGGGVAGFGPLSFTLSVPDEDRLERLMHSGAYEAAKAFVNGEIGLSGDIVAAIRVLRRRLHPDILRRLWTAVSLFGSDRLEAVPKPWARRRGTSGFIIYSDALFRDPHWSLERAQLAKLDLQPGATLLDLGWAGALCRDGSRSREKCCIVKGDYRNLTGRFRKIASVRDV